MELLFLFLWVVSVLFSLVAASPIAATATLDTTDPDPGPSSGPDLGLNGISIPGIPILPSYIPWISRRADDTNAANPQLAPLPSLPSLPSYGQELTTYLQNTANLLTTANKWLDHRSGGDVLGTWHAWPEPNSDETKIVKVAAGVTGLYGCTSVMIVSTEGAYASHIYQDPVFVKE
ncbi:hypothetical protein BJX99DRAFT_262846, partial [Aspergillus californicus]